MPIRLTPPGVRSRVTIPQILAFGVIVLMMAVFIWDRFRSAPAAISSPHRPSMQHAGLRPGGYRFSDYPRLGLPLSIIIIILVSVPVLLYVWPVRQGPQTRFFLTRTVEYGLRPANG
jgi:hypothetical protein